MFTNIIAIMIEENHRRWYEYGNNVKTSIGSSHFSLVYGHDAVISIEVLVKALRVTKQHGLLIDDCPQVM